jgi:opacity protein-like surface antigen
VTVSGYVDMERQFDIDLVLKAGVLVAPRTLVYGIAGPSFAKGTVKAGVGIDGHPDLRLDYEDDQWSAGWVLGGGVQHYFADDWSFNIQGDYRRHEFDASESIDETIVAIGDHDELYGKASSRSDVEDSIWSIKAGVAHHW